MALFKDSKSLRTCKVFGLRTNDEAPTVGLVISPVRVNSMEHENFYRDLFSNLIHYTGKLYEQDINLRVYMQTEDSIITDLRRELQEITDVDALVIAHKDLMGVQNRDIQPQRNYLRYISYPITPDDDHNRQRDLLPSNQYSVPIVYTVPSWLWCTPSASKDDDGGGINLLGYVFQSLRAGAIGKPEGDISFLLTDKKIGRTPYIVETMEDFDWMLEELEAAKKLGIDTEATSLNKLDNTMLTMQFCTGLYEEDDTPNLWVLPYAHPDTPFSPRELKVVRKRLRRFFEKHRSKGWHVYHNAKYDLTMLANQLGVRWYASRVFDIMAGEFCFDPDTLVLTDKGEVPIKNIVNSPNDYMVKSYDTNKGVVEYKPILNSSTHISNEDLYEIVTKSGATLRVTKGHKIWSVDRHDYIAVEDIKEGENVVVAS